jgi:D-alanyl-D-alanine carboxypeptidase
MNAEIGGAFVEGKISVRVVMSGQQRSVRMGLRARVLSVCVILVAVLGLVGAGPAEARRSHVAIGAPGGPVFAWILLDAETGQVLSEQNADVLTYPASLTKMMTLYLTFEALNQGRVRLDQGFRVSAEAASHAPSKLGLTPGDLVPLRDLILGVVTRSANDAAAVIAENLAGSEENFARHMTWKARQLGMQQTWYQNASGLPNPSQRTTARDTARLALALYHQFPREYRYFSTREFDFRGEPIRTHNHLLEWYQGADGIKTGFVNASGFNLAASAVRDGHRLLGVIMGGRSARTRDMQMASLLDQGFAALRGHTAPPQAGTLVVAAAPPHIAAPAASATVPASATAAEIVAGPIVDSASAAARTAAAAPAAVAERPATTERSDALRRVADAALKHLAPVSKASAAPAVLRSPVAHNGEDWAIQVGAFRAAAAAEHAARKAASLAVAKGKPQHIIAPAKSDRSRLYRVRLLQFTEKGAHAACAALKREGMACSVVRPAGVKVARG